MVGVLTFRSSSLASSPGRGIVLCSWARQFTFTLALSILVYKWALANLMLGVNLR